MKAILFILLILSMFPARGQQQMLVNRHATNAAGGGGGAAYLAHWTLNQGSGTSVTDSADSETGTLSGTTIPTWQAGDNSFNCLQFAGAGYVDTANFADNLPNFTVSCWVKTSTAATMMIVAKTASSLTGAGWLLQLGGAGQAEGYIMHDGSLYLGVVDGHVISDGAWHSLIMVVTNGTSATAAVTIYVDGSTANNSTDSGGTWGTAGFSNATDVLLGKDGTPDYYYTGYIQDVIIDNTAWLAAKATTIYNAGPQ